MSLCTLNYKDSLLFVSDFYKKAIVKININSKKAETISINGNGPGEINTPSSMTIKDNLIYVRDAGNKSIQAFTFNGQYVKKIDPLKAIGGDFMTCMLSPKN